MNRKWLTKVVLALAWIVLATAVMSTRAHAQTAPGIRVDDDAMTEDPDFEGAKGLDLRSHGRQMADIVRHAAQNGTLLVVPSANTQVGHAGKPHNNAGGINVQVNDPGLDHIISFPGITRPFEESTQSETSVAISGNNVLVGYNTSVNEPVVFIPPFLFATEIMFSGFSISHDGGMTWSSGAVPASAGSVFTFGDPAVGADRDGNFYYASLGADATGANTEVIINKSADKGNSFGTATVVAIDNGADKDWLAIGPDPAVPTRDNLYVTWTSFQPDNSTQLWLAKSTDGGATWTSKAIFVPTAAGVLSNQVSFSNPVVDATTGRLYVPFLHFTFLDADVVRVLVSDDAGATFHFLAFNVPDAPDAFAYPNVTPGEFVDCGQNNGGLRNVLHQGSDVGGGRFGLARYVQATRLITQPAAAAFRGRFFFALQSSTSPFFGDPTAGSLIKLLYSSDGGNTWATPLVVAPSTGTDPQHVHPAITLGQNGNRVFVAYYVQQADTQLRTDVATVHVNGNHLRLDGIEGLSSTPFDITPSNVPHPISGNAFFTTNYDRTVRACYNIGEYMSTAAFSKGAFAAWGDNRNTWVGPSAPPPPSAFPGSHAQPDVFSTLVPAVP